VGVGLGVFVGLGVNVNVGVGVSVATKGRSETPHAKLTNASIITRKVNLCINFFLSICPPGEKNLPGRNEWEAIRQGKGSTEG
jgi:hypothetical protein